MEPAKPSYAAILSSDKQERRTKRTDVNVDNCIRRPRSAPLNNIGLSQRPRQEPRTPWTVTGNSYLIFTTKNYGDNEMHWFWMVLVCTLLLFAWWKLHHYCRCPGPSKDDHRARREAKWHKRQLDEIEKQIDKYERKLEKIKTLRSSLGLDGVTSNKLGYSNPADLSSGDWMSSWPAVSYTHLTLPTTPYV